MENFLFLKYFKSTKNSHISNASQHSKYLCSAGEALNVVTQVLSSGDESTKLRGSSSDRIAPSDVSRLKIGRRPVILIKYFFLGIRLRCIFLSHCIPRITG